MMSRGTERVYPPIFLQRHSKVFSKVDPCAWMLCHLSDSESDGKKWHHYKEDNEPLGDGGGKDPVSALENYPQGRNATMETVLTLKACLKPLLLL